MHHLSRHHLRLLSLIVISLLFISACSNQGLPESKDFENQASFTFTIDPNDNSVTLEKNDSWLENLRSPAICNTARTLLPNKDLIITEAKLETRNNSQYLSFSLKNVTNTSYENLNVLSPNQKVQTIAKLAAGETSSSLSFPVAKGSTVFKLAANAIDLCSSENKTADVEVTAVLDKNPVALGQTFNYDVVITNKGPDTAYNLSLKDSFSKEGKFNLTLLKATLNGKDVPFDNYDKLLIEGCQANEEELRCRLDKLEPNESLNIALKVRVDAEFNTMSDNAHLETQTNNNELGTVINKIVAASVTNDPNHDNNKVITNLKIVKKLNEPVEPTPEADLEVTKTDSVDPVIIINRDDSDTNFKYTVTISNKGTAAAENVKLIDTFESPAAYNPSNLLSNCAITSNTEIPETSEGNTHRLIIECNIASLPAGESLSFEGAYSPEDSDIIGSEPQTNYQLVNTAEVSTTSAESNLSNNKAVETTDVQFETTTEPYVDLALTKEGPSSANVGEQVTYTLTVKNNGTQTATGVAVEDYLYFDEAIFAGSSGYCTYDYNGSDERGTYQEAECNLPDLAAGEEISFTVYATFEAAGTAFNTAEVTSNEGETTERLVDNMAEVTTEVINNEPEACAGNNGTVVMRDITISTQADLNELAGCTIIEGNLTIDTNEASLEFSPLDQLVKADSLVVGDFSNPTPLTSLTGFGALEELGLLSINSNPELTSIPSFPALKRLGFLQISGNPKLKTISGFNALTTFGSLFIDSNDALETIEGFRLVDSFDLAFLQSIEPNFDTTSFKIQFNRSLLSISGFDALRTAFEVLILANEKLASLPDFNALTHVENAIFLFAMDVERLPSFSSLTIAESIGFVGIERVTSLPDFSALSSVKSLSIIGLGITTLNQFDNVPDLSFIDITANSQLRSISGFRSVNNIERLTIGSNPVLTDIAGFESVTSIGEGVNTNGTTITINENDNLNTIGGFSALSEANVKGSVLIKDNTNLNCDNTPQNTVAFTAISVSTGNALNCGLAEDDARISLNFPPRGLDVTRGQELVLNLTFDNVSDRPITRTGEATIEIELSDGLDFIGFRSLFQTNSFLSCTAGVNNSFSCPVSQQGLYVVEATVRSSAASTETITVSHNIPGFTDPFPDNDSDTLTLNVQ